ncbi:hypothetical protein B0G83_1026 [Paraburkholderia sp. BL21I4N1]|nr:hypothetical protein B0G83_1026 [Paraburkholderia sp. BL21I4N1]
MALYVSIKQADDPAFVLLHTSSTPGPERKPPMRIRREAVDSVLALLLGAGNIDARSALRESEAAHV